MDDCIRAVESHTSPEEYKAFKRGVGHVMYEVFEQIVEPTARPPSSAFWRYLNTSTVANGSDDSGRKRLMVNFVG